MRRSRRQLRRASQAAVLLALGTGLSQGASVVAGYVTGLDGRLLAVSFVIGVASMIAITPTILDSLKKNLV
jgi:hypothetical protein